MIDGRQRQRHGVNKDLAEGIGGVLVGAAAVLLLRGWLGPRASTPPSVPAAPAPEATPQAPANPRRRPRPKNQPESTPRVVITP